MYVIYLLHITGTVSVFYITYGKQIAYYILALNLEKWFFFLFSHSQIWKQYISSVKVERIWLNTKCLFTLTTSIICINVNPKLSWSGSDSFTTGRSSTLYVSSKWCSKRFSWGPDRQTGKIKTIACFNK